MKISNRLKEIGNFITNAKVVVDVGCDHALLPIYLVLNNKSLSAIAVDNKIGPLNSAKENIKEYNLESKIKTVLSDGLKEVIPKDYDTIVISGMGGETIIDIISNGPINDEATLILEPNKNVKELREYLTLNSYEIIDEKMIKDKSYFYTIIKAIKTDKTLSLSPNELIFGPIIIKENTDIFKEYLLYNINVLKRQMNDKNRDEILKKISIYEGVLKWNY